MAAISKEGGQLANCGMSAAWNCWVFGSLQFIGKQSWGKISGNKIGCMEEQSLQME